MTADPLDTEPFQSTVTNRAGGVDIDANMVEIGGDAVGRDKITINQFLTTLAVPTLHQLLPPLGDFTGRDLELAELIKAINENNAAVVGIYGMGGVGKTTLALKLADQLKEVFTEAQFFFDLRGMTDKPYHASDAMAHIVHAYHPALKLPDTAAELRSLYLSVLYDKRALLLMDNVPDREQAELLLPPTGCLLLITSRQRFHLPGLYAYYLDKLKPHEANHLLITIAPRLISSLHGSEPVDSLSHVVDNIAELCGYIPLALRVAGSFLAERIDYDPACFVRRLSDVHSRLRLTGIDASLELSYEQLPDVLKRLWRCLAVFPADFDIAAATHVWDIEPDSAQDALSELVRLTLLEYDPYRKFLRLPSSDELRDSTLICDEPQDNQPNTGRYRLHDLARLFAESKLSNMESYTAQRHHAEHYLALLGSFNDIYLTGGANTLKGLAQFDLEWNNIKNGQLWAANNLNEDDTAARFCSEYSYVGVHLLDLRQHAREKIQWLEFSLYAARRLQDTSQECIHLGNLGLAVASLGDVQKAIGIHTQQLELARAIHNLHLEGNALANLGSSYAAQNYFLVAVRCYEQALVIFQLIGERRSEGLALSNLGSAVLSLGRTQEAVDLFERGLQIAREFGDRRIESYSIGCLGTAYHALGDTMKAIGLFEDQLVISDAIGDARSRSNALGNLGIAHTALGDIDKAIAYYERALNETHETGARRLEAALQASLCLAFSAAGRIDEAIRCYEQQLIIARELNDRRAEGNALGSLGVTFAYLKDFDRAIDSLKEQLAVVHGLGDRQTELSVLGNLGNIYYRINDLEGIAVIYDQIVSLSREEQLDKPNR